MLFIFAFFSIVSMLLVSCLSVAILNVVIRRESAYVVEERINEIVDSSRAVVSTFADEAPGCELSASNSTLSAEYVRALWPESRISTTVVRGVASDVVRPAWLDTSSFAGTVVDGGALEIRSLRTLERHGCFVTTFLRIPLNQSLLKRLSTEADLQMSSSEPELRGRNHAHEPLNRVVEANFIPGSNRPVAVVVIARNWQTGQLEDWAVCHIRPSYKRTAEDLSRMGMRTAAWVPPLGTLALALLVVYAGGLFLSVRLSQRIVGVIDGLSDAAVRVGKGDFSVRVAESDQDQLGVLASSFNEMTRDLEVLRQQEKQRAVLERDIALGHEVQQYLYPRAAPQLSAATLSGVTKPARIVSGDLYDFLPFGNSEVGLLCADVSGKGVSAALMMAHLQALAHGRLLPVDEANGHLAPTTFVAALNRDLRGRFGNNRYATMFYGEFDCRSKILRYVNAGHLPPILISTAGEAAKLTGGDLPVGLFPEINYQELRVTLSSGCAVVVYTDGVTDALNSQGEEFGEERLLSCCGSLPNGANANTMCDLLSSKVSEWSAGVEQFDDITILVLAVN